MGRRMGVSIYHSSNQPQRRINLPIYQFIDLPTNQSISPSIYQSINLYIDQRMELPTELSINQSGNVSH